MNDPKYQTTHPELGPTVQSGQVATKPPVPSGGEIPFNAVPVAPTDPHQVLNKFIAAGYTIQTQTEQFNQAVKSPTTE